MQILSLRTQRDHSYLFQFFFFLLNLLVSVATIWCKLKQIPHGNIFFQCKIAKTRFSISSLGLHSAKIEDNAFTLESENCMKYEHTTMENHSSLVGNHFHFTWIMPRTNSCKFFFIWLIYTGINSVDQQTTRDQASALHKHTLKF